jgi:predicted transcriptional regulator
MKEIHETMYPTTESTYIMTYSNLVCFYRQLMDRGYIQQKENKYSPLKLTEMGKAVLEYADIKKLTE